MYCHQDGFKCWQYIHYASCDPLSVHLEPAPPTPSVDDRLPHLWTVLEPNRTRHVFTDYRRNIVGVEMAVVVGTNS